MYACRHVGVRSFNYYYNYLYLITQTQTGNFSQIQRNERAPPTYSTLYPATTNDDDDHRPVLLGGRGACASFVARAPPPSYAQAQGICVAYSIQQLISNSGDYVMRGGFGGDFERRHEGDYFEREI